MCAVTNATGFEGALFTPDHSFKGRAGQKVKVAIKVAKVSKLKRAFGLNVGVVWKKTEKLQGGTKTMKCKKG